MLTIGACSKLSHVSARMLRHYDRMGLLRPAHVGKNGYRYYDESQLPILAQIETLKQYGFPLAEIGELLTLSQADLAECIHARRLRVYGELAELRATLRRMEEDVIRMEGTSMAGNSLRTEKYHVIVMEAAPQRVFGLRRTISIGEVHALFQELHQEVARRGLHRTGATQRAYHGEEFSYEAMDVEAQVEVAEEEGEGIHTIPACTMVATTHIGPYEGLHFAYEALGAWMKEHPEYHPAGPAIERYLKDEDSVSSPEELETGILFPVKKIG